MEPVTHALASLALGRAGLGRVARQAVPMLLVSGLAADLDWISYTEGAPAFLEWHRTASHSLLGVVAISAAVAAVFWLLTRKREPSRRVRYWPALAVCAAGAGLHVVLDLTNNSGVQVLWPFSERRFAWDLALEVDPGLLVILLAGLLLPALLNLVGEEIGARGRRRPGARGAIIAFYLAAAYVGGRAIEHGRADALLNSHTYRQEAPIRVGAFPTISPLGWHGVVETETALHEINVSFAPGTEFDARAARSKFKPDNSEMLQRALATEAAHTFLAVAQFPIARVETVEDGFEVQISDMRDSAATPGSSAIVAVIALNTQQEVKHSHLEFVGADPR